MNDENLQSQAIQTGVLPLDQSREQLAAEYVRVFPAPGPAPVDYVRHLADLQAQLLRLHAAAEAGDARLLLQEARNTDWRILLDEFESVVGRYRYGVGHYARRILRNLLQPFLLYFHVQELRHWAYMLEATLRDSPSLLVDVDHQVSEAWDDVLKEAEIMRKIVRTLPAVRTVSALRGAVQDKQAQAQRLEENVAYRRGERVPWP